MDSPTLLMPTRKRMDSIQLLRSFHGSNTVPMHDDDSTKTPQDPHTLDAAQALLHPSLQQTRAFEDHSPLSSIASSPDNSAATSPVQAPRRLKREDSISLLRRLNNWNTTSEAPAEVQESPRATRISELNKKFEARKKGGEVPRNTRVAVNGGVEDVYLPSPTTGGIGLLTRRDSISLQNTMGGKNTIFAMNAESPRWHKVALVNKKRAARKMREEKEEMQGGEGKEEEKEAPGIFWDDDGGANCDPYDSEKELAMAMSRFGGGGGGTSPGPGGRTRMDSMKLHDATGGMNTIVSNVREGRNRVDSVKLTRDLGGMNTVESDVREVRNRMDSVKLARDLGGSNTIAGSELRKNKGAPRETGLSPRQSRVKQLNLERNARKEVSRDDGAGTGGESKQAEGGRRARRERKTTPGGGRRIIEFGDIDVVDLI